MNKLVMNPRGLNNFRVIVLDKTMAVPTDEKEQILWAEQIYNDLVKGDGVENLFTQKNTKKGCLISAWWYDDQAYIVQSMSDEFGFYRNIIYITKDKEDAKNIAKALTQILPEMAKVSKKQYLDAKKQIDKIGEEQQKIKA